MDDIDRAQALEEMQRQHALDAFHRKQTQTEQLTNNKATDHRECESCGESIALKRLQIFPSATRCMACQTRYEQLQARMR